MKMLHGTPRVPHTVWLAARRRAWASTGSVRMQFAQQAPHDGAVGTLTHAAPELLSSHCNTVQSDVYAFGILMFELITGREPFHGYTVADLIVLKTSVPTIDVLSLPDPGNDEIFSAFAEVRSPALSCTV